MKIIISPAKKMTDQVDAISWETWPTFINQANELKTYLQGLSYEELKKLWQCNDKIATLNFERLQRMSLKNRLVPALLAYEGLQYQYMAPHVFDDSQWGYVKNHLVILSGFYGMLKPADGVVPYRLEMQTKFDRLLKGHQNLYQYWQDLIYQQLTKDRDVILNLASKEYSKVIERYLTFHDKMVTCVFGIEVDIKGEKRVKMKATEAKMARGEMVRYLAEHQITDLSGVKLFSNLDYVFSEKYSTQKQYVFLKNTTVKD